MGYQLQVNLTDKPKESHPSRVFPSDENQIQNDD